MAKIREITLRVFGNNEKFTVHYAAATHMFIARMPKLLEEYAKEIDETVKAASEVELTKKLKEFIVKFEERRITERKVIVYKFEWSSRTIPNNKERNRWHQNGECTEEAKIEFDYGVYLEKSINDKARYYKIKDKKEHKIKDDFSTTETHGYTLKEYDVIDWTQEREDFMKGIYASMETLMKRIKDFAGTPDLMLAAFTGGHKLLPEKSK